MCGIAGIIDLQQRPVEPEAVLKMTDILRYRGPDGEGYLFSNQPGFAQALKQDRNHAIVLDIRHSQEVAFGHRRLSIIDLNPGAGQPMFDATGRYCIVFNGEIYNHAELRQVLQKKGFVFRTDHSDTEVILNAYACWGKDCLSYFNGMWAFCLWDMQENEFFFSRDRVGKKPFYYALHEGRFYFASELKSLLVNKNLPRRKSHTAIYDYLSFIAIPAPKTIFENIYKLPAAHYFTIRDNAVSEIRRYWNPLEVSVNNDLTEDAITERLREEVFAAARYRTVADVEVGVLLSGGVDSTINLAALSKYTDKNIKAFSIGFENKDGYKNEFEFSRLAARTYSAEYYELMLKEQEFIDFFPKMVYYQDEPIADTANIPIFYIAEKARQEGVTVLLGGEGSDEILIGYKLWTMANQFTRFFNNTGLPPALAKRIHTNMPYLRNKRPYYHNWYERLKNKQPVIWDGTELRNEPQKRAILTPSFLATLNGYNSFQSIEPLYNIFKQSGRKSLLDWLSFVDMNFRLPDLLLARLDRMAMAASIEDRAPFIDVNVIEFSMSIPPDMKNKGGEEKYLLKKAFENIVPYDILYRPKKGFMVPLDQLFRHSDMMAHIYTLIQRFNNEFDVWDKEYISEMIQLKKPKELWNIANLALWYDCFLHETASSDRTRTPALNDQYA